MATDTIDELMHLLFCIAPDFRRQFQRPNERAEARMPHHHLFCLLILRKRGKLRMRELADALGVSSQQLTRITGELEEKRLIGRSADEQNRRITYVSLTATGQELLRRYYLLGRSRLEQHLSPLSAEETAALAGHLREVLRLLDKCNTR